MINAGTLIVCAVVAFGLGIVVGLALCHLDREDRRGSSGPPKGTGGTPDGWKA